MTSETEISTNEEILDDDEYYYTSSFGRKLKIFFIVFGSIILVIAAAIFSGWKYVEHELSPTKPSETAVRFTIPAGTGATEISNILKANGIIRNPTLFTYYLLYKKQGDLFKAGTYDMKPGITLTQIIDQLNNGDVVKVPMVRYSFPEGLTVAEMADIIGNQHIISASDFLAYADAKHNYTSPWIAEIPDDPNIKHRLEGFLFPETYDMKQDSTPDDIIQRMLDELDTKLQDLPVTWQNQMKKDGLNFYQIMTVASLIEREVSVDSERPIVASVIYNRLNKKMPLQIDATIQYLFAKPKDKLLDADLKIESPYNTYLHTGLPPGPIASPSLESIRAALYPAATKYLYYVAKNDGTHTHYFSETFAEHEHNIVLSNNAQKK